MRRAELADVGSVWRGEDPLEGFSVLGAALFQQGEDAAAVVVQHDDGQIGAPFVRPQHQPVAVVQESQVAEECVGGSAMRDRSPDRGRHRAVDAGHTPVAVHDHIGPLPRGQRDVPARVRRTQNQQGVFGQRVDDFARRRGPARPTLQVERRVQCRGRLLIGLLPPGEPIGIGTSRRGTEGFGYLPQVVCRSRPVHSAMREQHFYIDVRQQTLDLPEHRRATHAQHLFGAFLLHELG